MKPEISEEDGVVIVRPSGKIDGITAPRLQEAVEAQLDVGATRMIFDLSETPFVASAGLRVFAVVGKRLKGIGGAAVAGMSPNVAEVFKLVGFERMMPLCDTVEAAKGELAEIGAG